MKKLLIIVVVLLLAGGGAFFFLGGKKTETVEAEPKEKKLVIQERHYVRLDTITVTLFQDDAVAGLYTAALTLEIAHSSQRSVVSAASPRLRVLGYAMRCSGISTAWWSAARV